MAYLRLQDFYSNIQSSSLNQIISNTDGFRLIKQDVAISEIKSYLSQKYDVDDEFRDTVQFSFTTTYKAKQLVYLDASAYDATLTYALNVIVLQGGNVYYCKTAIVSPEAFTLSKWTLLGAQYDLFYIPTPVAEFDKSTFYYKDDYVFWKDKVYKASRDTIVPSHQDQLQYGSVNSIPDANAFPDSINTQWINGTDYSIVGLWPVAVSGDFTAYNAGTAYTTGQRISYNSLIYQAMTSTTGTTPGTDHTKWQVVSCTSGDNRNPQLVEIAIYLTLYKLSTRISPNNVPDVWVKNYDDAIDWLKKCGRGEVKLDAPLLQIPNKSTNSFRWGSAPKKVNDY